VAGQTQYSGVGVSLLATIVFTLLTLNSAAIMVLVVVAGRSFTYTERHFDQCFMVLGVHQSVLTKIAERQNLDINVLMRSTDPSQPFQH
jgi:hypothetical protein